MNANELADEFTDVFQTDEEAFKNRIIRCPHCDGEINKSVLGEHYRIGCKLQDQEDE